MEAAFLDQENRGLPLNKGHTGKSGNNNYQPKPSVKPLQSSSASNIGVAAAAGWKDRTIEETYQRKTLLADIRLRPDTYVGSMEKHTRNLWVYEDKRMVYKTITYVPGLYKIFDDILVNAADNKQRDPLMDSVKVTIDVEHNTISVFNNGDGVPVEIHREEHVYVPEMIFGDLLTRSTSYLATYGCRTKLANIFSTEFVIETADGITTKRFKQVFKDNMSTKSEPEITKCQEMENWTKVTFKPDLAKFNMTHLENDVVALMSKRVVDIAGCLGKTVKVELNGERVPVKSFSDYVGLYLEEAGKNRPEPLPKIYERINDRWEVCVSMSDGQFQQVSFVNSINTIKGGTHVQYVTDQIMNYVTSIVNTNKTAGVKPFQIRNHLWVFVNSLINNPAFDSSQAKEALTTRYSSFGPRCELSQEFLKKVSKSRVVESVLSGADFKLCKELKKNDGGKKPKKNAENMDNEPEEKVEVVQKVVQMDTKKTSVRVRKTVIESESKEFDDDSDTRKKIVSKGKEEVKGRKNGGEGKKRGGQKKKETTAVVKKKGVESSPGKKVTRMRPSPFHKKSRSVSQNDKEEKLAGGADTAAATAIVAVERPKRANRAVVHYLESGDEDEDEDDDEDMSEFDGDEDDSE